ncbi:L-arabinose transport system permease protein AraP [Meiothermus luteus]|jgi:multiple sugar transport system permease protein|uniref:L-arabinose transport system permease protein AraP n=1 Tax=Meiothermus luteus TaxID=2026184 RepID=A0A399EH34_9DEIN|nr:sugar ABC transporter permease [Meiothermus luteus]RIH83964.1 L-arabinose transport system permease protein AraP [Meiothermus luteus]RMH58393.1 MAG: ABC transporter permease subunit [Deinococcota bacterium]
MRTERYLPYALIAPSVLFLLFFFAWPLLEALLLSVRGGGGGWTLENFQRMAADLYFKDALKYTLLLALVVVPLQVVLALGMAMLLGGLSRGRDLFLYVWTIPLGISDLAAGIVWLAIFTERGYLNSLLQALGLIEQPQLWLSYETPWMIFLAVVAAEVWRATAIVFVILVAGLQLIPKEYSEAAEVFGATPWQRFWRVTLPLLKPSLQVALILRTILALEVFAVVVALGGRNLPVLAGEAYYWYNAYQNPGVAAAYAVVVLGISVLATLVYLRLMRPRQEEAA